MHLKTGSESIQTPLFLQGFSFGQIPKLAIKQKKLILNMIEI